jgi:ABC-type uncharacterized transport system permease subunit
VFQITLPFLYLVAAAGFAGSRLRQDSPFAAAMRIAAFVVAAVAIAIHGSILFESLTKGGAIQVSLLSSVSLIGLLLAVIGTLAAFDPDLRGVAAGLIVLAAPTALATQAGTVEVTGSGLTWQLQTHVFTAMFAYGLLAAGAIVAIYALVQDHRLRAAKLSSVNLLFAPLEKTERVLYGVASAGVASLALSMALGITFVENLFAQHLVHKTVLSLIALLIFGILLAGRHFAGWRGRRAIYLYLGGFATLFLAYFGSRYILEVILDRSWGG